MRDLKEESKYLASLAVFRELYDSNKDIYGVICELLDDIIRSQGKYQFNLTEITNLLNNEFDFSIPEAVVGTSLRRLNYLKKDRGIYVVGNMPNTDRPSVNNLQAETLASNATIIESLLTFIGSKKNVELTETKKENIVSSFYAFLLDDSNGSEYSEYISGFIIDNRRNEEFSKKLNRIREGVVLYSGLKYNSNLSEIGSWKTELTIYLDTEILFHFAGYNGKIYKSLFDDFFRYVKEINIKAKKRLIRLEYFREVKSEMESFFAKAMFIVEGKDRLDPTVTAMNSLIEGCQALSDVIEKKSDFYLRLKENGITESETTKYFEEPNHKYNIVDKKIIEEISEEFRFDVSEYLQFLNYVSIHRHEANSNNFDSIRHILLTGNSRTIKVAWHRGIKSENAVPLATTLEWITSRFWFKLNKGFGDGSRPISFDIITKAQIILSSVLNKSVREKYDDLQIQFKEGKITEAQAKTRIVSLRSQVRKPEEIEIDDISSILDTLSNDSIEQFIKEQELFKNEASQQAKENITLKRELSITEQALQDEEIAKRAAQRELIEANKKLLNEKKGTHRTLEAQMRSLDELADKEFRNFKVGIGVILVSYYLITFFFIWKYGWSGIEPLMYVFGSISIIIPFLYLLIFEKTWSPTQYLDRRKKQIRQKKYQQINFNVNRLFQLKDEIDRLEEQIETEKSSIPTLIASRP